jgi:hypothetical protein
VGIVSNFKATEEVRKAFAKTVDTFHSLGYATNYIETPLYFPEFDVKNIDENRKKISNRLFKYVDILILPTNHRYNTNHQGCRGRWGQAVSGDNTFFCNYYSLPAISLLRGFDKNGLPLGLEIVGS